MAMRGWPFGSSRGRSRPRASAPNLLLRPPGDSGWSHPGFEIRDREEPGGRRLDLGGANGHVRVAIRPPCRRRRRAVSRRRNPCTRPPSARQMATHGWPFGPRARRRACRAPSGDLPAIELVQRDKWPTTHGHSHPFRAALPFLLDVEPERHHARSPGGRRTPRGERLRRTLTAHRPARSTRHALEPPPRRGPVDLPATGGGSLRMSATRSRASSEGGAETESGGPNGHPDVAIRPRSRLRTPPAPPSASRRR